MTDNEIIKALKCCKGADTDCWECELFDSCKLTVQEIMQNALDLINRQQAEIKRLQSKCEDCAGCTQWLCDCSNVRADAIKEFAGEFEYEIIHKEFWSNHPYTSQVWLNGYEQCMRDIRVMLKDKVKEMVGEE